MNNAHPDEPVLLALADDELERSATIAVREHVDSCAECRQRLATMRSTLADFSRMYAERPVLGPPRPWASLRFPDEKAAGRRTAWPLRFPRWAFAAAAAMVVLVLVWKVEWTPKLNAAELLRKAVAASHTQPSRPDRMIRVRTRGRAVVRPASLKAAAQEASDSELQRMFAAANYSWDEPLAVNSYVAWRERLPEKDDAVETINANGTGAIYRVRTTTNAGLLAEATLSLRASDLHPIEGTFRFRPGELVEISELPEADVGAAPAGEQPAAAGSAAQPAAAVAPALGPEAELHAIAALHSIGADLGEPIDVERSGSKITVSGSGIGAQRQQQVREALAAVPGVELKFEDARTTPRGERRASPQAPVAPLEVNPELAERLGGRSSYEQFVNSLLDASDAALARAHSLRELAQRFTPDVEQRLAAADRTMLAGIRRDHNHALARHVVELRSLINAAFPELPDTPLEAAPVAGWQQNAQQLLAAAQRLDEMVNRGFASARGGRAAESELDAALRRLEALSAAARRLE